MGEMSRADLVSLARSVAGELEIEGRLEVREESFEQAPFGEFAHSEVRVSSSAPGSCPVVLALFEEEDAAGSVTISFGGSYHEVWSLPRDQTLAVAREFLVALMQGNYVEWRRDDGGGEPDVYGLLTAGDGTVLYSDFGRVSADSLEKRGYLRKTYRHY